MPFPATAKRLGSGQSICMAGDTMGVTMDDWRDVLGDGVVVSLELPVAPSARAVTASDTLARLLESIAALEDGPPVRQKDEPPAPELQRLEMKIDLLTDLVSSLLADRIPRPAGILVSGEGLVAPAALIPPDCDRLELYPCHWLAQPMVLELGPLRYRDGRCGAPWRASGPALRDALERWVFRLHRRDIARRRMRVDEGRADPVSGSRAP